MTLAKALANLSSREAEEDLVAVMSVFSSRAGQPLSVQEASRLAGVPMERASLVAKALKDAFVLDSEGGDAYRYDRDVAVEMELRSLAERLSAHRRHLQDNVTKFRFSRGQF